MIFDARPVLIIEWDSDSMREQYLVQHGAKLANMEYARKLIGRYGETVRPAGQRKFGPSAVHYVWPSWWYAL